MAKLRDLPDLSALAQPGAQITLRATPKASRDAVIWQDGSLRITVTTVPENGRANASIRKLLAAAMGVPQGSLSLIRGQAGRDKTFVYDPSGGSGRS